ncbi:uncharacterized protein [Battus philenor]|uniref:uncharacterized protein n=1 Tax=Battus philenor TaxID=42288 RepID=UPI0035CE9322
MKVYHATKIDTEYPLSPTNDESDNEEGQDGLDNSYDEEQEDEKPQNKEFADILKKLESTGALLRKPKVEQLYHCFTCNEDFEDWEDLENHLIQHVSLPSVVLDKLPSDEEDTAPSGDENWSDDEVLEPQPKPEAKKTPQKVDLSQILKKTGVSIKKAPDTVQSSDAALNKLSGLGFTIKKSCTIKKEKSEESEQQNESDLLKKLGKLGGIKLKLKSDGCNTNTFKVINGLKDFKASDDEDDLSENEDSRNDEESGQNNKNQYKNQDEDVEPDSEEEEEEQQQRTAERRRSSELSDSGKNNRDNQHSKLQGKRIKIEPAQTLIKAGPASKTTARELSNTPVKIMESSKQPKEIPQKGPPIVKTPGRPSVKQTPKRGMNTPVPTKSQESSQAIKNDETDIRTESQNVTKERRESYDINSDKIVIKTEAPESTNTEVLTPDGALLMGNIKTEKPSSPPLDRAPTPIIAKIKTELDTPTVNSQPQLSSSNLTIQKESSSLPPVTKTEDPTMTIIEINGDSNDEDDDCCVVSSTPASDVKPVIPKVENQTSTAPPAYSTSLPYPTTAQSGYSSAPTLSSRLLSMPSTEKQHNFNWNAPDSKPAIDMLEKSADEIFESLLSSSNKKENISSLSDVSEYISLDTLGPQHSCETCNTRFTNISLLEEHKKITGHSNNLIPPSASSTLMPYNPTSNILSSLLPVKQLAEQVGKLSTINSSGSGGFTHQQNVMINIQAYPGASGMMAPPPPYNAYPTGQSPQGYPQTPGNMYTSGQAMSSQYPGSNYSQSAYSQYPPAMSKAGYPGPMPSNVYSNASSPYSTGSPLQSMQQSVYGQSAPGLMNQPPVSMGPPGSSPSQVYASATSPSSMKQSPSNIRIQNVQTFPPGQTGGCNNQPVNPSQPIAPSQPVAPNQQPLHGQEIPPSHSMSPWQSAPPTHLRIAVGPRPRMPNARVARPSIRPGIQLQVRGGGKMGPRMPLKRPSTVVGGSVPKRRTDMLLPGKHDNEDCQVMALQKQREGLPLIQSVQGAKDKLNIGSQISITKKTVNKEANAMANVLASRGISVKQKQKSRSPSPQRPLPNIPNLGAGVSIKHSSKSSNFSIPEAKIGTGMLACRICKKMFMSSTSLSVHMSNAHPQSKIPVFKCDECPASYPKSLQLQHHKRIFHNVTGSNRELGLPVVDLSQEDNLKRLSSLGIYSFIPLANREQGNGCFGIPVISVHNVQNGMASSLQALGADGLLSLGPLKPLPNS